MKCIVHTAKDLVPHSTRYGIRYSCPVGGCSVVSWNGNSPADYSTRQARIQAHNKFDQLWKSGMLTRRNAYKKLARFLEIPREKTHIANFDLDQCQRTLQFAYEILEDKSGQAWGL